MTPIAPDIRQHVARRIRITRMFFRLSLEETSAFLGIPVWLLYYKENGLVHFSYQDFLDMERLYKMPWMTFFQDFFDDNATQVKSTAPPRSQGPPGDSSDKLDAIMQYLTLGEAELSATHSHQGDVDFRLSESAYGERAMLSSARRWA